MSEGSHFREHTRAPLVAAVRLQLDSFAEPEEGFTANVSAGGMFVQLRDPKPVGTRLRFWLTLPDQEQPASGYGEVVWIRVRRPAQGGSSGVGIEFRYLSDQDRERIISEVDRVLEEMTLTQEPSLSADEVLSARRAASPASPTPSRSAPDPRPPNAEESGSEVEPREPSGGSPSTPGHSS